MQNAPASATQIEKGNLSGAVQLRRRKRKQRLWAALWQNRIFAFLNL
jgi:hypothetical protein